MEESDGRGSGGCDGGDVGYLSTRGKPWESNRRQGFDSRREWVGQMGKKGVRTEGTVEIFNLNRICQRNLFILRVKCLVQLII